MIAGIGIITLALLTILTLWLASISTVYDIYRINDDDESEE